jgi:hypothetical protein
MVVFWTHQDFSVALELLKIMSYMSHIWSLLSHHVLNTYVTQICLYGHIKHKKKFPSVMWCVTWRDKYVTFCDTKYHSLCVCDHMCHKVSHQSVLYMVIMGKSTTFIFVTPCHTWRHTCPNNSYVWKKYPLVPPTTQMAVIPKQKWFISWWSKFLAG